MPTLIHFGAGNIGRAVIAPIFLDAGYEVIFVDVDEDVVKRINEVRHYRIVERQSGQDDVTVDVGPVSAVNGLRVDDVVSLIAGSDLVSTSVGGGALKHVAPVIARGITARRARAPGRTLDVIVAENLRDGAEVMTRLISDSLDGDCDWLDRVGVSAASIERAVPLMSSQERAEDLLRVICEPATGLIIDRKAFRGAVPAATDLTAVDDIRAYIDRKILIFNMAHAATAYVGNLHDPGLVTISDAIQVPEVKQRVRDCIAESATGLAGAYAHAYDMSDLLHYGDQLLGRFANEALRDTMTRVGRDLMRKLSRGDRMLGAMLSAAHQNCPCSGLAYALRAAFEFRRTDGEALRSDTEFLEHADHLGISGALTGLCGLRESDALDSRVMREIEQITLQAAGGLSPPCD